MVQSPGERPACCGGGCGAGKPGRGCSGAERWAAGLRGRGACAGRLGWAWSGRTVWRAPGAQCGAGGCGAACAWQVLPVTCSGCSGTPPRDWGCWSLFCPCGKVLCRAPQGQEEIAEGTLEMPAGRITLHPGPGTHREAESPGRNRICAAVELRELLRAGRQSC